MVMREVDVLSTLQLRRFDISSVQSDGIVVVVGRRETGKTVLVKDLLHQKRDIPVGTVVAPTESYDKHFGSIVPPMFIHNQYMPSVPEQAVERQREIARQTGACGTDPRSFLILDNCLWESEWVRDGNIVTLANDPNVFFVITMPYPLGLTPVLRQRVDYVFILREIHVPTRKRLYDLYAGMFPTFDVFCQVLDQCTQNFECLVIDLKSKSTRIEDQVFYYKAEPHESFRVCAPEWWAHTDNLCPVAEAPTTTTIAPDAAGSGVPFSARDYYSPKG